MEKKIPFVPRYSIGLRRAILLCRAYGLTPSQTYWELLTNSDSYELTESDLVRINKKERFVAGVNFYHSRTLTKQAQTLWEEARIEAKARQASLTIGTKEGRLRGLEAQVWRQIETIQSCPGKAAARDAEKILASAYESARKEIEGERVIHEVHGSIELYGGGRVGFTAGVDVLGTSLGELEERITNRVMVLVDTVPGFRTRLVQALLDRLPSAETPMLAVAPPPEPAEPVLAGV